MAPSIKELRSQLKSAMKPIGKMSRDELVLMIEKHKGGEVVMPKKKLFLTKEKVAEHKELVDVLENPTVKKLKKESVKQEKELKELTKVKKVKKVKVEDSSSDEEMPVKSKKSVKMPESDDESSGKALTKPVKVKKEKEDKSSSSSTESKSKKQMWGELRKTGLSSAEAWAKLRE